VSVLIAQISDIHAKPGGKSLAALALALAWLETARPDAVIVSGDVANPPWTEGYDLVREALEGLDCPVLMVPGNKDDRESMRASFPQMGWTADEHLSVARTIKGVRLVGLDVMVPGEKHGDAGPALGWLREQLTVGEPVLLFMHQHPFNTGFGRVDIAMCRGVEDLADAIVMGEARVMLLTCGHGHRAVFSVFAGAPAMMCPSLAKANLLDFGDGAAPLADPPGFALHVVEGGRVASHVISLG
jgi:3',5'-cyclic-AMP phosphodiesterase